MKDIFDSLAAAWPAPVVARREIARFSGGLINPRTIANLDSQGIGPRGKFRIGPKQVGYPVLELVIWMRKRAGQAQEQKDKE